MTDKTNGNSNIETNLKNALIKHNQEFMLPLFDGFELSQSDVDFVTGNTTSNTAEAMALTLKWISGRTNAAYRREFMGEISSMRKAVDAANEMAKSAKNESTRTGKQARRDFWLTFTISFLISLGALAVSIWAILD